MGGPAQEIRVPGDDCGFGPQGLVDNALVRLCLKAQIAQVTGLMTTFA